MDSAVLQQAITLWQGSQRAVALTGAGISTPSGIPDFRSAGSGLWQNREALEAASLAGFRRRPERFYHWFRSLAQTIAQADPNPAHRALATLERHGPLQAVITQNIDLLHSRAGSQNVFEVHGHLRSATCLACGTNVPSSGFWPDYIDRGVIPECKLCSGPLKPDVILFGENLPTAIYYQAEGAVRQCDLLVVAGSSLAVWPVNELPLMAKAAGAKLLIVNHEPTECDALADLVVHEDVAIFLPQIAAAFWAHENER